MPSPTLDDLELKARIAKPERILAWPNEMRTIFRTHFREIFRIRLRAAQQVQLRRLNQPQRQVHVLALVPQFDSGTPVRSKAGHLPERVPGSGADQRHRRHVRMAAHRNSR